MTEEPVPFSCGICGNTLSHNRYVAREMMFGLRDEFTYIQCAECECLQITKPPDNFTKYYPNNYYSLSTTAYEKYKGLRRKTRLLILAAWVFNRNWRHRLLQKLYYPASLCVLKNLHVTRNTRILDVGCGQGHKFLYPLADLGFTNLLGCDPFVDEDVNYPNGLQIRKASIFDIKGTWDVITYHHAFEHVTNPLENLQKAYDLLADDGVCILRMPTVSSYAWKIYRTNWVQLDAPRHLYLHSVTSLELLAAKAGLSVFRIEYDSTYKQFADSERYIAGETLRQERPKGLAHFVERKLKKLRFTRLARKLNADKMGDQAAFFLRKTKQHTP